MKIKWFPHHKISPFFWCCQHRKHFMYLTVFGKDMPYTFDSFRFVNMYLELTISKLRKLIKKKREMVKMLIALVIAWLNPFSMFPSYFHTHRYSHSFDILSTWSCQWFRLDSNTICFSYFIAWRWKVFVNRRHLHIFLLTKISYYTELEKKQQQPPTSMEFRNVFYRKYKFSSCITDECVMLVEIVLKQGERKRKEIYFKRSFQLTQKAECE